MPSMILAVALVATGPPAAVARPPARELVTVVMPPEIAAEVRAAKARKAAMKEQYQAELRATAWRLKQRRSDRAEARRKWQEDHARNEKEREEEREAKEFAKHNSK